ncbi:PASTA domain-containing protein [Isoptericola sp. NPDC019571]|uniref:PASTA domain-containing protein n=1 Tax=Isoptericola sp. NPDC019571 TaxID=3364008 RepID=UPI0037A6DCA9
MRSPRDTGRGARVGRLLATATTTCVVAAGFLAAPVAGLPWNDGRLQTLAADQHTPDVGAGSPVGEGVSVGVVGTPESTGPTTLQEVLGVLERAELAGQDAGRKVTPAVDQAAAELGMLLSTYLAQQSARSSDRPFAAADAEVPSPVLPAPATEPDVTGPAEQTPEVAPSAPADEPRAVAVARQIATDPAAIDPADEPDPVATGERSGAEQPDPVQPDAVQLDAVQPDEQAADQSGHDGDEVTFDDLVVAATRLATLLDPATTTLEAGILPAGADGAVAARATLTASLLEVVDRYGRSTAGYANGRIPASALCPLDFAPGHMLRCDAAEQLSALSKEYEKEFGVPIPMTDSYRSLELQIRVKATKGWLAATPGTSNHGWGLAVDLGYPISTFTSAEHAWMRVHGPDYGWDNPSWARSTGSKPEPWHFEFFAAGPIPDRAWKADDVAGGGGPTAPAERADKNAKDAKDGNDGKGTKSAGGTAKDGAVEKGGKKPGSTSYGGTTDPGKGGDSSDRPATPAKVTVPDVAGQSLAAAKKKLQALGLEVTTVTRADDDVPEGTVVTTRHAGTKVRTGSTVTLVVSSGPEQASQQVAVPKVAGKDEAGARQALTDAGLVPAKRVATRASDAVREGDVVGTDPVAGSSVDRGATVTIVVSSGPAQVKVPAVEGDAGSAKRALQDVGLAPEVVEEHSDTVDEGHVIRTEPGAGTPVDRGAAVRVVVSSGPEEPEQVEVPGVVGEEQAVAVQRLKDAGFVVEVVEEPSDDQPEGVVVRRESGTEETLPSGSTVTLVVSTGPE